jgi:hypothetical protein
VHSNVKTLTSCALELAAASAPTMSSTEPQCPTQSSSFPSEERFLRQRVRKQKWDTLRGPNIAVSAFLREKRKKFTEHKTE